MTQAMLSQALDYSQLGKIQDFAVRVLKFGCELYVFSQQGDLQFTSNKNLDEAQVQELFSKVSVAFGQDIDSPSIQVDHSLLAKLVSPGIDSLAVVAVDCSNANRQSSDTYDFVREFLELFADNLKQTQNLSSQIEIISGELAQTYEELVLLYKMSMNMRITQSESNYLQLACDNLTDLVKVEGIAILLEKEVDGVKKLILTAGSGVIRFDNQMIDSLELAVLEELAKGNEIMLDGDQQTGLRYNWPAQIRNIIAVPLKGKDQSIGLMVAANRVDKAEFDSIDAKLFNSVAHECGVFIENGKLIKDLKELFIGALKSLTNSIDAKDQYTRGHSERVAFISRWIAEKMIESGDESLTYDQIHEIYLAGLLHDIGKIGIDETVLRKKGALDDDEWLQIKSHPKIGASILTDIKQMKKVIPGVLTHHERIDGRGYPDGLKGDEIPLIGKIINVADSFDAMISKRVYRDALSVRKALKEIEKGLGTQFDEKIGTVFLDSDTNQLWEIIQDGFIERWDYSNFSEYGAEAVGTLLK